MSKSQSLKTYYGIETGEPPAAPAPQPTLDEWTTDKPLHALLKASNELMDGIRDLYADRQSLVYNHHQELVNASETVGHMRHGICLLYTSPSPRDLSTSRMPSSA